MVASIGVSEARYGRRAGLGRDIPMTSKPSDLFALFPCGRGWRRAQARRRVRDRDAARHRAISQVVPSLESLIAMPIAASWSRIRSDSLKSFRARAAARSAIKALIRSG